MSSQCVFQKIIKAAIDLQTLAIYYNELQLLYIQDLAYMKKLDPQVIRYAFQEGPQSFNSLYN